VFSDVSQLFLSRARQTFAEFPFVRYERLDIERDPVSQQFDAHSFDIAIASNVVHATRDLRQTLANVRKLLKPGGILVLLEGTERLRWVDLTFGLTSGWWRFEDFDLRPSYPLMPVSRWQQLLPSLGFDDVATLPAPESAAQLPKQMVLAARAAAPPQLTAKGVWLIVRDRSGLSDALSAALVSRGYQCCVVAAPEVSMPAAAGEESGPLAGASAFGRLIDAACAESMVSFRGVVHLGGFESRATADLSLDTLEEDVRASCRTALYAAQALASVARERPAALWLVTRGAQPAPGGTPRVSGSPLWGLGRTIAMEHPETWGGMIDVDDRSPADAAIAIADELDQSRGEDEVALRGNQRLVARLVRTRIDSGAVPIVLRGNATYLLTGGSGGMGVRVAQWLAERGARHLVLVSRRGAQAERGEIQALIAAGVDVRVREADVSRPLLMAAIVNEISETPFPLAGIIHAAGIFDDRVLLNHDWGRFERVLAPKVSGAWILHELTRRLPLDFFVMFSSAASVLGPVGLGNYAAANAFLDALAHYRRGIGLPAVSLDWGAWQKTGMADAVGDRRESQWTQSGFETMSPEEGLDILGRAVVGAPPQVAVLPVSWPAYLEWLGGSRQRQLYRRFAESSTASAVADPAGVEDSFVSRFAASLAGERLSLIGRLVGTEVATVLGFPSTHSVDPDQGLFDLGMDSLTAVELKNRLQRAVAKPLPATLVFDYPSIQALTDFLARELGVELVASGRIPSVSADNEVSESQERADLSEDDLAAMLAAKLGELG
jgi:NAD(P)-dependent dehydrogenase (short-subunit alcohol dehydrogenase family)/acyl carrier protein